MNTLSNGKNTATKSTVKKIMGVSIVAALFCLSVQSNEIFAESTMPKDHFYIGGDIGMGGMDNGDVNLNKSYGDYVKSSKGGTNYHAFFGYAFQQNERFSIGPELGYLSLAENTYEFGSRHVYSYNRYTEVSGFNEKFAFTGNVIEMLMNATYKPSNKFYLIGKVGFGLVNQTLSWNYSDTTGEYLANSSTQSKLLPEIVLGLGWEVQKNLLINLSMTQLFAESAKDIHNNITNNYNLDQMNTIAPIGIVSLGIQYNF